ETFTDGKVNRPEIQAYLGKIKCRVHPDTEWEPMRIHPWNHSSEVIILLKDGTKCSGKAPCARGYPDLPLTTEEIVDKFKSCAGPTLQAKTIDILSEKVLTLEAQTDVSDVIALTGSVKKDR
ncbi:MAG: hypothetical protein V3R81_13015, partial [Gammaproteobacteria bacterium]